MTHDKLVKAFLQLRLRPNKDLLQELIEQAEKLDQILYTDNSWQPVKTASLKGSAVYG